MSTMTHPCKGIWGKFLEGSRGVPISENVDGSHHVWGVWNQQGISLQLSARFEMHSLVSAIEVAIMFQHILDTTRKEPVYIFPQGVTKEFDNCWMWEKIRYAWRLIHSWLLGLCKAQFEMYTVGYWVVPRIKLHINRASTSTLNAAHNLILTYVSREIY